jgi:hypothetical protein
MQKYFISFISKEKRRNVLLTLMFNFFKKNKKNKITINQINIGLLTMVLLI